MLLEVLNLEMVSSIMLMDIYGYMMAHHGLMLEKLKVLKVLKVSKVFRD